MYEEKYTTFFNQPKSILPSLSSLSAGDFAQVYDSDGFIPNTVMKSGNIHKDTLRAGWPIYAAYVMANPHPSFPRIYALNIDFENGHFYAIIEKLEKMEKEESIWVQGDLQKKPWNEDSWSSYKPAPPMARIDLDDMWDDLRNWVKDEIRFDGHEDNWMWRVEGEKKIQVLTDPFVVNFENRNNKESIRSAIGFMFNCAEKNSNIKISGVQRPLSVIASIYDKLIA